MTGWADLALSIDGAALTDQALIGLRLSRRLNAPAELSLAFSGHTAPNGVEVSLQNGSSRLFLGEVCRTVRRLDQDGPVTEIVARDRLTRLSANRQRGSTDHRSILGVFKAAAASCGLEYVARGIADFTIGRHMVLETDDLAHLAKLAHRYGIGFAVADKSLILTDLVVSSDKSVELGHDTGAVTEMVEVDEPALTDTAQSWHGWVPDADQTLTEGKDGPGLAGQSLRNGEPAARLAAANRANASRSAHWIKATVEGLSDLTPGAAISLPEGDGRFATLSEVEMLLDVAGGARTRLSSEPPVAQAAARNGQAGFVTGRVARTDDPEKAGRVMVALNGHQNTTTGWLSVIAPQSRRAGGTGLAVPAEIGDPVLLATPDGDPEMGIVLGVLVRGGGAGAAVSGGSSRTGQVWRGDGATVLIDEANGAIDLSLDDGTSVKLTSNKIELNAAKALDLNCSGRVRIKGSRIDFEEAE